MRVGRERLKKILAIIGDMYPEARGELEWETPFQLLIAVILSAQTTDKAVNKVTPNLWKHYPEIEDLAKANLADVEECLRTIGLYIEACSSAWTKSRKLCPKDSNFTWFTTSPKL